jgi:hypothetical protein
MIYEHEHEHEHGHEHENRQGIDMDTDTRGQLSGQHTKDKSIESVKFLKILAN